MTRVEDIAAAQSLGVDFLGFIFEPSSPRCISLQEAKKVRSHIHNAAVVGVFEGSSADKMTHYARELDLDFLQIYGNLDDEALNAISIPIIHAFRGVPTLDELQKSLQTCAYVLIDKEKGKEETDFDAIAALPFSIREKMFLAGGLTPKNVRMTADRIHPYAVDCARGIESQPGIKDHDLMQDFISSLSAGRRPAAQVL